MSRSKIFPIICFSLVISLVLQAETGFTATLSNVLPGPADIDRIKPEQQPSEAPAPSTGQNLNISKAPLSTEPVPKNARHIHFVLKNVVFKGVTVFTPEQLQDLYSDYFGKNVTLDVAWKIAADLTQKYRQKGYFLSQAFVPAQEVSKGTLVIRAAEGYISDVSVEGDDVPSSVIINHAIEAIKADRPTREQTLERQLLLLNDLPGLSFQATLAPAKGKDEAARLILTVKKTHGTTTVSIDNGGSRYLGPYEASAAWTGSLIPLEETDLFAQVVPKLSSTEGKFYTLDATQKIVLTTPTVLDVTVGYSNATPGYTLQPEDVESNSVNGGIGISYHFLRQREENLSTRLSVDFRNSNSDILDSTLYNDRIRAVNLGVNYDRGDSWWGHNYLDVELRHGLPIFDSSSANDTNLSRPDVHPDFTKATANYTRLQSLTSDWSSSLILSGQKASGSLYSSEEFGYGGNAIGRAYDTSEISGDDGLSGSLEMRYQGLQPIHQTALVPYAFYDIGKVWNANPGQPEQISGASVGPGIRIQSASGISGNFYVAEPLTKAEETPIYGGNGKKPRVFFQLSDKF
jgi:hemolysin activation/secretion protein